MELRDPASRDCYMCLRQEIHDQGQFLFRWRSYFPLFFIGFMVLVILLHPAKRAVTGSPTYRALICLFLSLGGLGVRVYTVGHVPGRTSGRNTKKQLADRLNTTGLYSVIRHPLYLGNFVIGLGTVLYTGIWWMSAVYTLSFYLYYERIMVAEEEFLRNRFGSDFERWSKKTPAFIPRLKGFQKPRLSFCLRTVLKREYPGFLAILLLFALLDAVMNFTDGRVLYVHPLWLSLLPGGAFVYLVLRTLKRRTRILHVPGR